MIDCMVFLGSENGSEVKSGLGVHSLAAIPSVGELISLSSEGNIYRKGSLPPCRQADKFQIF